MNKIRKRNVRGRNCAALGAAFLLVGWSAGMAIAVCNQSNYSLTDSYIYTNHSGCSALAPDGVTWFPAWAVSNAVFHVSSGDGWSNRGWNDACNLSMEFTKLWNSFYLIQNGPLDNNDVSWHGQSDYAPNAHGNESAFHNEFYYKAEDGNGVAFYTEQFFGDEEVKLQCGSFNHDLYFGDGAVRAASIQHEGWHGWQQKHGVSRVHPFEKDYFAPHGVSEYLFGYLHVDGGDLAAFHSPSQVEYEFSCDLYISSQSWVVAQVKAAAQGEGNRLADNMFVDPWGNPVLAPSCEDPRPWTIP